MWKPRDLPLKEIGVTKVPPDLFVLIIGVYPKNHLFRVKG